MTMDIYGQAPSEDCGKVVYYTMSVWPALWRFCCLVGEDIIPEETAKKGYWNDKAGLDVGKSEELADKLEKAIEDGTLASFVLGEAFDDSPKEGEQAIRRITGIFTGEEEGGCPLSEKNVQKFINFLRCCGGFEIW